MKGILLLNKPIGLTPLQALEEYKRKHSKMERVPMSYAGRLDPMAEGLLLVVYGDALKQKKAYMNLDKEYAAEFLFGISSDTYDILGIIQESHNSFPEKTEILNALKKLEGMRHIHLPPYSSYRIKGKALFSWAREKKLNHITIPKKKMAVYEISSIRIGKISGNVLKNRVGKKITRVSGDFRQDAALRSWEKVRKREFVVAKATIQCSSGTYIRSLANLIGKKIGTGAILLSLTRTKIGKYRLKGLT